jgi:hypothetical protein
VPSTTGSWPGGVVLPLPLAGQPLVQPLPGAGLRGPVPGGGGASGHRRGRPRPGVEEPELRAVPGRAAARGRLRRRGRGVHDPVAAEPASDLDGQVAQQPGQPGQVVAGVEDGQDVRVAVRPVPGFHQPGGHVAQLGGGNLGGVVVRADPDGVQRQGPRGAARPQCRYEGVRPARDDLLVAVAPRVAVAEKPFRGGLRVRPQPVRDIAGQPDPAVVPRRQRQRRQRPPKSADHDIAAVQRVVDAAVPAAALRLQAQLRQHAHPLRPARQRVARLEQRVPALPERQVQLAAEPRQPPQRQATPRRAGPVFRAAPGPRHTECHGHRHCLQVL